MATNTNFAVAIHAMAVLAYRNELTSSDVIATSINTNPVVVRRVMAKLVKAGLAMSTAGKHGGFLLARRPKSVKLVDVLRAVDDAAIFRIHENKTNPNCPVSCNMKGALAGLLARVEDAVERELGKTTLHDVVAALTHVARTGK
jgi:Rrf2 family protein